MSQCWQAVGNTVSDLTGPRFKPQTSRSEANALPLDQHCWYSYRGNTTQFPSPEHPLPLSCDVPSPMYPALQVHRAAAASSVSEVVSSHAAFASHVTAILSLESHWSKQFSFALPIVLKYYNESVIQLKMRLKKREKLYAYFNRICAFYDLSVFKLFLLLVKFGPHTVLPVKN